jgi:DNA polymerase-1
VTAPTATPTAAPITPKTWGDVRQGDRIVTNNGDVWHVDLYSPPTDVEIRHAVSGKTKNVAAKIRPAGRVRTLPPEPHPAFVAFDIETCDGRDWFRRSDAFRLGQVNSILTDEGDTMAEVVATAADQGTLVVGHNICAFDLPVLGLHHGLDLTKLRGKIVDTDLLARVLDPPPSGKDGVSAYPAGHYSLDQLAKRYGVPAKTDDLKALAKRHGGYDKIPTDDPEYVAYLAGDIAASAGLFGAMPPMTPYALREMNVGLITAQMMVNGFRVDVPELHRALRIQEGDKAAALFELNRLAGVPLTGKSPLASDKGKEALETYLTTHGVRASRLPRTPKTGKLQTGREALEPILAAVRSRNSPAFAELEQILVLVMEVVGQRTVYRTADTFRHGDRVHPSVRPTQASGRWSVTGPGLTVYGKRGGRHVERRIFIPEEGHSLIAVDLDQVDARAVAAHSQDPEYMRIFQEGLDVHGEVAVEIFGDRKMREVVKPISHGWNYGRSAKAISAGSDGRIPLDVAEHFDAEMRRKYPRLVQWQNKVRDMAERGILLDNGFGRKMRADPMFAYTQAPALVGQGATRDILAEGMLRLPVEFWPYLRTVVHDELVLSVPTEDAEEIGRVVVEALSFDFMGVPITSQCSKPGATWAAVYEK